MSLVQQEYEEYLKSDFKGIELSESRETDIKRAFFAGYSLCALKIYHSTNTDADLFDVIKKENSDFFGNEIKKEHKGESSEKG